MRDRWICPALFALIACGCAIQTGLAPTETVIESPSIRDFGFAGTWKQVVDEDLQVKPMTLTVKRTDKTQYEVSGREFLFDVFSLQFSAVEVSPDRDFAIVEAHISDATGFTHRRLFYAGVRGNELRVWSIHSGHLGDLLYDRGATAVLENSMQSSRVRCNPKILLEVLRENPRKLLGELHRFKRIPAGGN